MRKMRGSKIADEIMRDYFRELRWKQRIKEREEQKKEEKCINDTR